MNKAQENKRTMFIVTQSYCRDNKALWDSYIPFNKSFGDFESIIEEINQYAGIQIVPTTGAAQDKQEDRDVLEQKMVKLFKIVSGYAAITGDQTMKESVNYTASFLKRQRDTMVVNIAINLAQIIDSNLVSLAEYNITAAMLDDLQASISQFKNIISIPRNKLVNRKGATQKLRTLFKEADEILKEQLDKLIANFEFSHPTFVQGYQNSRMIIDLGRRHRAANSDDTTGNTTNNVTKVE